MPQTARSETQVRLKGSWSIDLDHLVGMPVPVPCAGVRDRRRTNREGGRTDAPGFRYAWQRISGGTVEAMGIDIGQVASDGRIAKIVTFDGLDMTRRADED